MGRLSTLPHVFGLFLFIFGPEEGSNQMGEAQKTKTNPKPSLIRVWMQLRLSNIKEKGFSSLYFSFCTNIKLYNLKAFSSSMNRRQCKFQIKRDAELCSPEKLLDFPTTLQSALKLQSEMKICGQPRTRGSPINYS